MSLSRKGGISWRSRRPFEKLLANQSDRDVHGATELTMLPRSVKHMSRNSSSEPTHVTRLANPQRTSREDDEGLLRQSTNADKITMVAWRIEPAFLAHMEARTTGILETKTRNTCDVPTDLTSDAQCGMCPQTSLNVHDRQTLTKENLFPPFEVHHPTQHQTARAHSAAK